jgi:hypothetical protein
MEPVEELCWLPKLPLCLLSTPPKLTTLF